MIDVDYKMVNAFFDRPAVQNAIDKETRRAISKSLAYVRTRQRSLLRRRKKPSAPGSPPSVHSRDPVATLKKILFAYNAATKSGVVGPIKLNQRQRLRAGGVATVSQLMEFGGRVLIEEQASEYALRKRGAAAWRRRDMRRSKRRGMVYRRRRANYPARPSARPALEMETQAGNVLSPWANVVQQ